MIPRQCMPVLVVLDTATTLMDGHVAMDSAK